MYSETAILPSTDVALQEPILEPEPGIESFAELARQRLEHPALQLAARVNAADPEYRNANSRLAQSLSRSLPEKKMAVPGIQLLGEEIWLGLQSQLRTPETRHNLMDAVAVAMQEESEALKAQDIIETDVFFLGNGVHTAIGATQLREKYPNLGIVAIGEGNVFGISRYDAWLLNTGALTPHDETYKGIKVNRDMNHLPGLPIQPKDIDARLFPGNTAVGDAVTICEYLAAKNMFGVTPDGSVRPSQNPDFKYELSIKDTKTGKTSIIRCNTMFVAGGFGKTDSRRVGDEATQSLIAEELKRQEAFMEYLQEGKLSPTGEIPAPGQIINGIEHAYPMFGFDKRDPLRHFRNKRVAVVGAGGHTGLTMLMNLANVSNSSPGFDIDPHGDGQVFAYGLKTPTRNEFLSADDLPVYKPLAEALPVEEGAQNAFIIPIDGRAALMQRKGDKIIIYHKDPKTGELVLTPLDLVILTSGLQPTISYKDLFSQIPGFQEGITKFGRFEPENITQKLAGHNIYMLGSSASGVEPKRVSLREKQLMPGFSLDGEAPVMARTVPDTYNGCRVIANSISPSKLQSKPSEIEVARKEIPVVGAVRDGGKDNGIVIPYCPLPSNDPVSDTCVRFRLGTTLQALKFPSSITAAQVRIGSSPENKGGFLVETNFSAQEPQVAGCIQRSFFNPMVQEYLRARLGESPTGQIQISLPIMGNKIDITKMQTFAV